MISKPKRMQGKEREKLKTKINEWQKIDYQFMAFQNLICD